MHDALFRAAYDLGARRTPYALAVVVRHERPISGKAGDKAIILADGSISGWIGGGCTKPLIIAEAQKALADGRHRLVRIAPSAEPGASGIIRHEMTCHSGGALDIYIEPVLPRPQVVIFGRTELAQVLCRLAAAMHYRSVAAAPGCDSSLFGHADQFLQAFDLGAVNTQGPTFAVIATQGEHDAEALREALAHELPYVAFVASRQKAKEVLRSLALSGMAPADIARVRTPAGLDIGARLPEEIALSVLAEIVSVYRSGIDAESPIDQEKPMAKETIHIEGMSCSHCVMTVRKAIEEIEGVRVHDVQVGSAEVSCDGGETRRQQVLRSLEAKGFAARLELDA